MVNDKPCVKCGGTDRYKPDRGRNLGKCKACRSIYFAKYYTENFEKLKTSQAKYRAANPEKMKIFRAKFRAKNPDYAAKYRADNPDYDAKYYAMNREKYKVNSARYRAENPEKFGVYKAARRARKLNAKGTHTAKEWIAILAHYNNACLCCGATENIHKDHIVPLAMGGANWPGNLQPLCKSCNSSKGTKTIDYRPGAGAEYWQQDRLLGEPV